MSNTMTIGKKLVELCREGKAMEAIHSLYSDDIVSIEAGSLNPGTPAEMKGLAAVKGKSEWWEANHEVHSANVEGPYPNGDQFIVHFKYEVTPKVGPMAGKRITMDECGLYTVKGEKIGQEEFFYSMGG